MNTIVENISEKEDWSIKENVNFSNAEIESLLKTKQEFLDGKTTARDWSDIEKDLDRA